MDSAFAAIRQDSGRRSRQPSVPFAQEDIDGSIPARFERIVRLFPDRLTVKDAECSLTYDQLNRAINRIAHAIRAERGDASEPIALLFDLIRF